MNPRIRWVGAVLMLCFVLLFLQLNSIQVRQASRLASNPMITSVANSTPLWNLPRGKIVTSDGYVIAYSKRIKKSPYYERVYPSQTAEAFAPITGAFDNVLQSNLFGVESSYNSYLQQHESPVNTLGQLLSQHTETDSIQLTISKQLQLEAYDTLKAANEPGSAMVIVDPHTGKILAMAEYPSFDPNMLTAPRSVKQINDYYKQITSLPGDQIPYPNIATYRPLAPGSTFKVVTTSAIFDHDPAIANQSFPTEGYYSFPNSGKPPIRIHNYGYPPELCPVNGNTLAQALAMSCDTAYSKIGVQLGPTNLALEARSFGFDSRPPVDLPASEVAVSNFPSPTQINATPYMGYSAIGQFDDTATALQMALVVAAIANNGVIMRPYLVSQAVSSYGTIEYKAHPQVWRRATSASTAAQVRKLMLGVTQNPLGTAYGVFQQYGQGLPTFAAKTGTAEPQKNVCGTYNWLVSFGPADSGQTPSIAGAAVVPIPSNSASCISNPTGASVAGPVLIPTLRAALAINP